MTSIYIHAPRNGLTLIFFMLNEEFKLYTSYGVQHFHHLHFAGFTMDVHFQIATLQ